MDNAPKPASPATARAYAALAAGLPADDGQDFADARRGFLGTVPEGRIVDAEGRVFWNMGAFDFEAGDAPCPPTVNPSLWRQAKLNAIHGLFEVTPGLYQVRGFDISNITFIEGDEGYIVIDPLISSETAAAALALLKRHRGEKPVTAVIYTHSHVDHYGGVRGSDQRCRHRRGAPHHRPGGIPGGGGERERAAGQRHEPEGDVHVRGPAAAQPHRPCGRGARQDRVHGHGEPCPADGEHRPNRRARLTVDGVEIVFQVTPDTEAPAEMNFYFPKFRALCMAENCSCHLHNLYTPRGAQVRDAKAWSWLHR